MGDPESKEELTNQPRTASCVVTNGCRRPEEEEEEEGALFGPVIATTTTLAFTVSRPNSGGKMEAD